MMQFDGFELKYINKKLNLLISSPFLENCDRCDSKMYKLLSVYACAHARERQITDISLLKIRQLVVSEIFHETRDFFFKTRDVFPKTTRRFP